MLTLEQLKEYTSNVVTKTKLSTETFNVTRDNTAMLVDKIGKIDYVDSLVDIDKLNAFDGDYLEFGKIVEEWQEDLLEVLDFDSTGANALAPKDGTYRPAFYSYPLPRKVIKQTIRNNDIERAVNNPSELSNIVAMKVKRISDTRAAYRYQIKREMIAKFIELCEDEMDYTNATAIASITTSTPVGTIVKNGTSNIGIVVKKYVSGTKDWATSIENGIVVELDLITEIAKPVDTSTGEAFVKAVKDYVEKAGDLSEGNSLNGNTLGAGSKYGMKLILKQGIKSVLDTDVLAGAFNKEDLGFGVDVIVIKDFGSADSDYYAVLMDGRAMRLFNSYKATREDTNGFGDFLNLNDHSDDTAYISRNAFVHVFKAPTEVQE